MTGGKSRWNAYLDLLLAHSDLTRCEHRLALALGRELLGWNQTEGKLGRRLLCQKARMGSASFERAQAGLAAKGIITVTPGGQGPGNRTTYTLALPAKVASPTRPNPAAEMASPTRPFNRSKQGQSTPSNGLTCEATQGKNNGVLTNTDSATTTTKTIQTRTVDAYTSTGGILEFAEHRAALAAHATRLHRNGTPTNTILAAARQLGAERAFPGYLSQRAHQLTKNGGPCQWEGIHRQRLTPHQLATCNCAHCTTWLEHTTSPTPNPPLEDGSRVAGPTRKKGAAT
jgi:hypothetical protein